MQTINPKLYVVAFIFFLLISYPLALFDQEIFINVLLICLCIIALLFEPLFIIFLYIVFLPTNGIYSTEENVFGYFSLLTTTHFFASIYLLFSYNKLIKLSRISADRVKDIKDIQKLSSLLIFSLFLFIAYSDLKNGFLEIYDVNLELGIRRLIKSIFRFLPLLVLIKLLVVESVSQTIKVGILTGIIFLTVTSFFTDQFIELNLIAKDISEVGYGNYGFIKRHSGFFGWGDVNSFGVLLVIFLGYYVYTYYHKTSNFIFFIIFSLVFVAIIYTGSRTTFTSLFVFIFIFSLIQKGTLKYKFLLSLVIAISMILIVPEFNYALTAILGRFGTATTELDTGHKGTRIAKWIMYYYYIVEYPYIFITGTFKEFWLDLSMENYKFYQRRVPHNLYISMLFQSGFVPVSILIYSVSKIFIKAKGFLELLYILLPFVMISMYVSDLGYAYYFALMLPIMYIQKVTKSKISSINSY